MGYLIHLGLALLAQVIWEETGADAAQRGIWEAAGSASQTRLALLFCLLFVPHVLGWLSNRLYLRGRFRLADRLYQALHWSPVYLHAIAIFVVGWVGYIEHKSGASARLMGWPGPLLLVSFLPFVVFSLLAIDARSKIGGAASGRLALRVQARLFAAALVPLVGYVLISSCIGRITALRLAVETVALWNAVYAGAMLVLFASCLPWLLRHTWETEALPAGPERTLFDAVSKRANFDGRRLVLWHTGFTAANAAIIGLLPAQRIVIFSDLLLSQLDLRQLASVYAHEIGHAKRNHVLIFSAWAFAALFGADLLAAKFVPDDAGWTVAVLGVSMGLWAIGFGWISRRVELEADIYSLRLIGEAEPLIQALQLVSGPHGHKRTSWRHFSTERRIAFLEAAVRKPELATRLERRLWWVSRAGFLAFLIVMGLEVAGLARGWPRDQVVLDLRRGDYSAAVERIERRPVEDVQVTALVRRAATLKQGDPADLERQARAAFARGDPKAADEWLDLGALRGDKEMERVQALLLEARETPAAERAELLKRVPQAWRATLEPLLRSSER